MKVVIFFLAVCVAAAAGRSYCRCDSNDLVCTYDNETKAKCEMECERKEYLINCEGHCPCVSPAYRPAGSEYRPTPCGCDNTYKPVHTMSDNYYMNKCQAECNGEVVCTGRISV
ncbi:uncharacterized protein LOC128211812 [Mya arenaria]|uniref:uncharacterized protein LOC128211812 n=1 Tax=Mya arenaria TaxID=6604 RepID=UPI0022E249A8|nr:uncharacterized protein LOC128211812 [Mya arenaria]